MKFVTIAITESDTIRKNFKLMVLESSLIHNTQKNFY